MKDKTYMQIKLFNKPVLFSYLRIDNNDLPKNIHKYEVRSDDEGIGMICEISKSIRVNFWGTILSDKPIDLTDKGYLIIDEEKDVEYMNKPSITIKQYINKQLNKNIER